MGLKWVSEALADATHTPWLVVERCIVQVIYCRELSSQKEVRRSGHDISTRAPDTNNLCEWDEAQTAESGHAAPPYGKYSCSLRLVYIYICIYANSMTSSLCRIWAWLCQGGSTL